jgi:hypothetical protein
MRAAGPRLNVIRSVDARATGLFLTTVCATFEYDFIIIILTLSFQDLLKWAGVAEDEGTDAGSGGHPEGVIDSEIASEAVMSPKGPTTMGATAGLPVDATIGTKESEV